MIREMIFWRKKSLIGGFCTDKLFVLSLFCQITTLVTKISVCCQGKIFNVQYYSSDLWCQLLHTHRAYLIHFASKEILFYSASIEFLLILSICVCLLYFITFWRVYNAYLKKKWLSSSTIIVTMLYCRPLEFRTNDRSKYYLWYVMKIVYKLWMCSGERF